MAIKYINVKCTTSGRKKVYEKVKKYADDKHIDMTDALIMILDEATRHLDTWYEQALKEGKFDESMEDQ